MKEYRCNDLGELVEVSQEEIDARKNDPEKYCREFCQGHKASYDRSVEEGPCFYCDIFE